MVVGGHSAMDPASKEISLQGRALNIYGAFIRERFEKNNGPVTVTDTATGQSKIMPLPEPNGSFRSTEDYQVTHPAYDSWLTGTIGEPDFHGFIKELTTGAVSVRHHMPDIDTFVSHFQSQAHITVDSLQQVTDDRLPCPWAWHAVTFANASTLRLVQAAELDVSMLNFCNSHSAPLIIYSRLPIRLVNGSQLDMPLTVVSEDAIYIKGDFNVMDPKPAAAVSANRIYQLSQTFRDYTRFIDVHAHPTLADAVQSYDPDGDHQRGDRDDYLRFVSVYGDPAVGDTLPPFPHWLLPAQGNRSHADVALAQRLVIVAPAGRYPIGHYDPNGQPDGGTVIADDHALLPAYGLLENWGSPTRSVIYQPYEQGTSKRSIRSLYRYGAFINLPDDHSYELPNGAPQDYPALLANKQFLALNNIATIIVRWHNSYEPALSHNPPPGFKQAQGRSRRQRLWTAPTHRQGN